MNHPAVTKAAANITQLAHVSWPSGTVPNMTTIAEIIERETKYSRLVEAATKMVDPPGTIAQWSEMEAIVSELRSVLAEIKDLGNGPRLRS